MRAAGMAPKRSSRSASVIPVDLRAIDALLPWVSTIRFDGSYPWSVTSNNYSIPQERPSAGSITDAASGVWQKGQARAGCVTALPMHPRHCAGGDKALDKLTLFL